MVELVDTLRLGRSLLSGESSSLSGGINMYGIIGFSLKILVNKISFK